ncbi:hypothetical protein ACQEVG_32715 [Streptomyces sp. CA-135486]|uniref:hypothetical protein n=1 Tax=Streptomyces sp. CA-135486 TaxID=3240049 RepID=UPI003D8C1345
MPSYDKYDQKVPYPKLSDAPNIETAMRDLVNAAVANTALHFDSATDRAATLTGASAPFLGMLTWLDDVKRFEYYDGTTWKRLVPPKAGNVELLTFTSRISFTKVVTFPTAFSSTPGVTTNINSGTAETAQWHSRAIDISPTGFTLFVFSPTAAAWDNVPVRWDAAL